MRKKRIANIWWMKFYFCEKHSKLDRISIFVESIRNLTRGPVFVKKHSKLDRYKGNKEIHGREYP